MTDTKLNLKKSCLRSIEEICEHRKKGAQAALKFVCQVSLLGQACDKTNMKPVKDLIQTLFDSADKHLSADVKTRYTQAVLYIQSKKWKGSAEELFQKCEKVGLKSCRKLSDAYAEQKKKLLSSVPSKTRNIKTASGKACRVKSPIKTISTTKKQSKPKSCQKLESRYLEKIERLIKQGQKKQASCVLKGLGVEVTVTPI